MDPGYSNLTRPIKIRLFQLRLDVICASFFVVAAVMLIYLSKSETFIELFNLSPSAIGLTLSKCFTLLGNAQVLVKFSCQAENLLTSLERILEYSQV